MAERRNQTNAKHRSGGVWVSLCVDLHTIVGAAVLIAGAPQRVARPSERAKTHRRVSENVTRTSHRERNERIKKKKCKINTKINAKKYVNLRRMLGEKQENKIKITTSERVFAVCGVWTAAAAATVVFVVPIDVTRTRKRSICTRTFKRHLSVSFRWYSGLFRISNASCPRRSRTDPAAGSRLVRFIDDVCCAQKLALIVSLRVRGQRPAVRRRGDYPNTAL